MSLSRTAAALNRGGAQARAGAQDRARACARPPLFIALSCPSGGRRLTGRRFGGRSGGGRAAVRGCGAHVDEGRLRAAPSPSVVAVGPPLMHRWSAGSCAVRRVAHGGSGSGRRDVGRTETEGGRGRRSGGYWGAGSGGHGSSGVRGPRPRGPGTAPKGGRPAVAASFVAVRWRGLRDAPERHHHWTHTARGGGGGRTAHRPIGSARGGGAGAGGVSVYDLRLWTGTGGVVGADLRCRARTGDGAWGGPGMRGAPRPPRASGGGGGLQEGGRRRSTAGPHRRAPPPPPPPQSSAVVEAGRCP